MGFVIVTDTAGVSHRVHTSQINARILPGNPWRRVWEKFEAKQSRTPPTASQVPGRVNK